MIPFNPKWTIRFKVPKTALSSESCILIEWYVGIGDLVKLNQPLYLIESEKTTIEVPSPDTWNYSFYG